MTDQKNMILAIVLSVLILLGFQFFVEQPKIEQQRQQQAQEQAQQPSGSSPPVPGQGTAPLPGVPGSAAAAAANSREAALALTQRVRIETPRIQGSIALKGARIDDVVLTDYRETLDDKSPPIHLLDPTGLQRPYYAEFGWVGASGSTVVLPTPETVWTADSSTLTPDKPVTLSWSNGQGLTFERVISVDRDYLFTVTQRVVNDGSDAVVVYPYGLLSRGGTPETVDFYILHEGPLGVFDDTLTEVDYTELQEDGDIERSATGGWIGIPLAATIPLIIATYEHLPVWQNDQALWENTMARTPDLPLVHIQYAWMLRNSGQREAAISRLRHTLAEMTPDELDRRRIEETIEDWSSDS